MNRKPIAVCGMCVPHSPYGEVAVLATHEQVLGGPAGLLYQGCLFPARAE